MPTNFVVFAVLWLLAGGAFAHEGQNAKTGEWIEKHLTVKHDSNWSTEHCLTLPGNHNIQYRFSADIPFHFDFHLHPVTDDGSYRTEHLDRETNLLTREGRVEARLAGAYCFDFIPVQRASEDKQIRLFYRID